MKKSHSIQFALILISLSMLTSCGSKSENNSGSAIASTSSPAKSSPSPKPSLGRAQEVQIKLDVACEYVRKGFKFEGINNSDAEVNFSVAADTFREVILDYQVAQQFMDGAISASREVHRWPNGATLIQGAREQSYISRKDGEAIISIYNYCVATDPSATD